jgi:hypothetical protein
MLIIIVSLMSASFFALIGQEGRISARIWALISFGLFWILFLLADTAVSPWSGFFVAMLGQLALFIAIAVIWVLTPRKSTRERYDRIEALRERSAGQGPIATDDTGGGDGERKDHVP